MSGDYVSREAARNALYEADAITMKGVAILNKFPAADVVKVVWCSECRKGKWDPWTGAIWCEGRNRRPDFYCADGERKNGGQGE